MISARLRLRDLPRQPRLLGRTYRLGDSYIEGFGSPMISLSHETIGAVTGFWAGEDPDPFLREQVSVALAHRYRQFRDYEGVKIFFSRNGNRDSVQMHRSCAGGCPLYVAAHDDIVVASWKFEEAVEAIPNARPNIESCRSYLKEGTAYIREQIIGGVYMLWPGESVSFDSDGLKFEEADSPSIPLPGTIHESARVTEEFLQIVADAMKRVVGKASAPLVELSGGLDSTCVAIAAKSVANNLNSYAVVHEGAMGLQQRRRRAEVVGRLKTIDFEGPSYHPPPFASLSFDECTMTPLDDPFRLPCVYAVDQHPAGQVDVVITGIGGDELTKENTFRRFDYELPGHNSRSAATAAAGRADMFMRRGIWPIHPLIAPSVVDFCRALPPEMRAGRMLNILTIARFGISDGFLFPRYKEHYGNMYYREASLLDFDQAMTQSIVADFNIMDIGPLLKRARDATITGFSAELISELYLLLKLEVLLGRYVK